MKLLDLSTRKAPLYTHLVHFLKMFNRKSGQQISKCSTGTLFNRKQYGRKRSHKIAMGSRNEHP